jgi:hypothetical protein
MVTNPAGLGTKNDCAGEVSRNLPGRPISSSQSLLFQYYIIYIILGFKVLKLNLFWHVNFQVNTLE